ncbi:MAG: dimethylamine/trimethylamine dehydrogenase [Gaiellales bacterium]|jgi:dimethylamine/trimethylamine dehydrogenase|nr:dimethylamine/trimethylamine dehydrogenase [Gaiellales bacterium]
MREARYDILFEPVQIGPVTARNRFFQVPHCNGMGHRDPTAHAWMRGVKAEGGWAVVCTEEVEIHHTSEVAPYVEGRIWDDRDIPAHARLCEKVHEHGGLAGIELCHNGMVSANMWSREAPMGPSHLPVTGNDPVQARRMTKDDIADLRRWHRRAVERSLQAGYDVVYVYAGHDLTTLQHFLSRRYNDRTDEYGGSLENRTRLLREVLEDTREACEGRAGVACRIAVDELIGSLGIERAEIEEVLGLIGELPDVWDFMVGSWPDDSMTSRFAEEGYQEPYVRGLKQLTSKPVIGIGRFTSADTMVRMVREGVLDFIGAARPSIADPFLPKKIEEGRWDDICECIGCNICVTGDFRMTPLRCTQNPSMGEEWRRGWHPERFRPRGSDSKVLVVGGGPAGLEAAMALGKRGYEVVLAEASDRLGGRVEREARLPGLASYIRVADYRKAQLAKLPAVEQAYDSRLTAEEILSYGFEHVAVATGATWRRDGVARWHTQPIPLDPGMELLTPDDLMAGTRPRGEHVVIYDDDHYYMAGVLAELLVGEGSRVTLVTPAARASEWADNAMEQERIQKRLLELGVDIVVTRALVSAAAGGVTTACAYTGREEQTDCDSLLLVTARIPDDAVMVDLLERRGEWADAGLLSARAVGDAYSPGTVAAAVWDGRRFAEELDEPLDRDLPTLKREVVELAAEESAATVAR